MPHSFSIKVDWTKVTAPWEITTMQNSVREEMTKVQKRDRLHHNAALRLYIFCISPLPATVVRAVEATIANMVEKTLLVESRVLELHSCQARASLMPERIEFVVDEYNM